MTTQTRSTVVLNEVVCPNGEKRKFTVQSSVNDNKKRGFIKLNKLSVSGIAHRKDERYRWRFTPNMDGKNASLMRIPAISQDKTVRVTDPSIPEWLRKYHARIVGVQYDGLTPVYEVQFKKANQTKPRKVSHGYLEAIG
jgi:hypothetical protein